MTVLAAMAGLVFLLLGTLSLPVAFCGRVRLAGSMSGEVELAWAAGLVGARVAVAGRKPVLSLRLGPFALSREHEKPSGAKASRRRRRGPLTRSWRQWTKLFLNNELLPRGVSYARSVLQSLNLSLRLEGEYGTGDPALTGYLCALMTAFGGGPVELYLQPVFGEARLDVRGELRGRLIPARLMWLTGGFLLARPVRPLWWSKIAGRKSKSKRRS